MGADTTIGELFDGRYRLERRLGSGGMADVYLATDESLGRHVAIKILSDRYARDDGFVERFRREASAAAGLNHPNIVSVYDRGEAEGTYYIAMEFLDGPTLKDEITRRAPLPEAEAIGWATQALEALEFAHSRGVVHRDVKPHNMVLTNDGRLKVTDFGIARAANTQQMTEVGSIVGTAQYLSPEQARGLAVGPQSDLYSLGIVMYEMLTGELPFNGGGAVDIAMKQVSEPPPPLRERNRLVSPAVEQVVMRALAKDPALRHASAQAMADELRRVGRGGAVSSDTQQATQVIAAYGGGPASAPTTVMPAHRPPAEPAGPRRSALPWLLVALLLAATTGIGYIVYQHLQSNDVTIPTDIRAKTCTQATAELQRLGFRVGGCPADTPSNTVHPGHVVGSTPDLGSSAAKGSTVTLHASSGPSKVALPNLAGTKLSDALDRLSKLGFTHVTATPVDSPARKKNYVVSTLPAPGQGPLSVDTPITVRWASGYVPIPDVTGGLTCPQATQKLQALTLVVTTCQPQSDPAVPKDQVIGIANQTAGNIVPQGTSVTLLVSSGPGSVPVPYVVGETKPQARHDLKSASFKVLFQNDGGTTNCVMSLNGTVERQTPAGNSNAPAGSFVTITIYTACALPG